MQYAEPKKPFTQDIKCNDGTESYVRHVDARFSREARKEAEEILHADRKMKVSNKKFEILTNREYSKGVPAVSRQNNQRQRRKIAAQNR